LAVANEFGVAVTDLFAKRLKNNEARVAAVYLIRRLTSEPARRIAERYGGVSQAAISKTVQRAETRRNEQRRWKQRLSRLDRSLRAGQ
jgi:chromosomal replication initiation ATPase DnaA